MKFKFIFVLIFLSFLVPVSASTYNIELNQVDGAILVKHVISLESFSEISIPLPADAYSISSDAQYSIEGDILTAEAKTLKISYLTNDILEKSGRDYYLVTKIPFQFDFNSVNIKLIMEEGYHLDESKAFPVPSTVGTDGTQIYLEWKLGDVSAESDVPLFVSIKSSQKGTSYWTILIISSLVVIFILYYIYKNYLESRFSKKEKTPKKKAGKSMKAEKTPIESHLLESEKAVIQILKQADRGELWQKELQLKTGFSKAKLSRVIRNLESRNLVDKVPFGNTNKIRLL
ncbi:MAG: hypothetical protein MUF61_01780 [archaeon]|jgi:uncharacterized membrane protein|nr:hypothetical protein [archaeon]